MTFVTRIAALTTATAAAATLAWTVAGSGDSDAAAQAASRCRSGVCACVRADASMQAIEEGAACPTGQRLLQLARAEPEMPDDWDDDPAAPPPATTGQLGALERRLDRVEQRPLFEVVTAAGASVFTVASGSAVAYDRSAVAVFALRATGDGGWFVARTASGEYAASLGSTASGAGLRISRTMPRPRWPDSTNSVSDVPGTLHC